MAKGTDASDSPVPTKNSKFNNRTSAPSANQKNNKWGTSRNKNSNMNPSALSFKGLNVDLRGKVFVKGPLQAANYDEAYKALLSYIGSKYDHRVYKAFEYKDRAKGSNLLTKSRSLMMTKVIQVKYIGENSTLTGTEVRVIDKMGKSYEEYQILLKQ